MRRTALIAMLVAMACGDGPGPDVSSDAAVTRDAGAESCEDLVICATACAGDFDCYGDCLVAAPPGCTSCVLDAALQCSAARCATVAGAGTCLDDCVAAVNPAGCIASCDVITGEWANCVADAVERGRCNSEFAVCAIAGGSDPCLTCTLARRTCAPSGGCGPCLAGHWPAGDGCVAPTTCLDVECGAQGECEVASGHASCGCQPGYAVLTGMACAPAMIDNQLVTITDGVSAATFNQGGPRDDSFCHQVSISHSYAIQRHEVTIAEYDLCVVAGGCQSVRLCSDGTGVPDPADSRMSSHPMSCVDVAMAARYCAWLGGRLPSESEWEYAAVGDRSCPAGNIYPWGDAALDGHVANYAGAGNPFTAATGLAVTSAGGPTVPVGFFDGSTRSRAVDGWLAGPDSWATRDDASPFAVAELAGNLAEWTLDCWHPSYDGAPADGRAWSDGVCAQHVKKGEAWSDVADALTSWFRAPKGRGTIAGYMGFRCVVEPAPEL